MSRVVVAFTAGVAFVSIPIVTRAESVADIPVLTHPFDPWPATVLLDVLFGSLAHFDAVHYLAIASDGYVVNDPALAKGDLGGLRPAFFPAYPVLVAAVSAFTTDRAVVLLASCAVSLACFFGALVLLHRLTEIELGRAFARPTLVLLAFFPAALFFSAPYSESLFLLVSVAAVFAARSGRWASAGILLGLCSLSRPPGVLVAVPVLLLYLYGPRADHSRASVLDRSGWRRAWPCHAVRPDIAWLGLVAVGPLAFTAYLQAALGDGTAWLAIQDHFGREFVGPFAGALEAVRAGVGTVAGAAQGGTPRVLNAVNLPFLGLVLVAGVAMLRVLPPAYGAYTLVSMLPPVSSPIDDHPLMSLPRFVAVVFPIFMWLAVVSSGAE